jgi:hypothetical protein
MASLVYLILNNEMLRFIEGASCFQASGFREGLILHTCEREGPSHWQHHKVANHKALQAVVQASGFRLQRWD